MIDFIVNNLVPLTSAVAGAVAGILGHKYTSIASRQDAIKQLLEQNAELVAEVNRLQDKVVELSAQLTECQVELSRVRGELRAMQLHD